MIYATLLALFVIAMLAQAVVYSRSIERIQVESARERRFLTAAAVARTPTEAAQLVRAGERKPAEARKAADEAIHPVGL